MNKIIQKNSIWVKIMFISFIFIINFVIFLYFQHIDAGIYSLLRVTLYFDITTVCVFLIIWITERRENKLKVILTAISSILFIGCTIDFVECSVTDSMIFSSLVEYILKIFTLLICVSCIIISRRKEIQLHKLFLIVCLALGISYMFVMTPLAIPDEQYHYRVSYCESNYLLFKAEKQQATIDHMDFGELKPHDNVATAYNKFKENQLVSSDRTVEIKEPCFFSYPFDHLPQAIGIACARILGLGFCGVFYLGRLFNLLFYVLCTYFAIKLTPAFKCVLFVVATLPMAIHQAASLSSDSYINGMAFLLIALIIRAIYRKDPMAHREILSILIVASLLAPAKVIYISIIFVALLIPKERFISIRSYLFSICILFLIPIAVLLVINGSALVAMAQNSGSTDNYSGEQFYILSDIMQKPLKTINIYIDTIDTYGQWYFETTVGRYLAGLCLPINPIIIYSYVVLMFLASIKQPNDEYVVIRVRERILFLIIYFGVLGLVMTAMLLGWTPNSSNIIQGVQGRYLLPVLPLALIAFRNNTIESKIDFTSYIIPISIILQYFTINSIINYTF